MVKLTAPLMSLGASGSIGGAVTYSTWKGRPYARELVKPANPKSGGQVGVRAMFKFLSQVWASLSASDKATWEDRANDRIVSPFNAFVGYNMALWRNFKAPSWIDPWLGTGTAGTIANEAATAGVRQIDLEFECTVLNDSWATIIFRAGTTGFDSAFANAIAIVPTLAAEVVHYIDTPLAAGTYYYVVRNFTIRGVLGEEGAEITDTVV